MQRLMFLILLLALAFMAPEANAVVTATPAFCQTPQYSQTTFVQGTDAAGTYKTIYTGGANGSKITGIVATSNDGSLGHLVTVQLSTSTAAHCSPQSNCGGGAAVTIPSNAGFATVIPAVNMISATNWPGLPLDSDGNPFIYLSGNTQTLEATFATALTASTQLAVLVFACAF